jgi:hypothetical protein
MTYSAHVTKRQDGGGSATSKPMASPARYADARWAMAVCQAVQSLEDIRTTGEWCRSLGISRSVLAEWCHAAGARPKPSLDLARVVRALPMLRMNDGQNALNVVDRRTVTRLLQRGGLCERLAEPMGLQSVGELLRSQKYVRANGAIDALIESIERMHEVPSSLAGSATASQRP